jgi:hypothetical protein
MDPKKEQKSEKKEAIRIAKGPPMDKKANLIYLEILKIEKK